MQTEQVCRGSKGERKCDVVFQEQQACPHSWGTESRWDGPEGVFHAFFCINLFIPRHGQGDHLKWLGSCRRWPVM